MDEVTLENFRCFREEQTAKLAPLTLLVGDNSTGKTSFMALIRALWDVAYLEEARPDFKEEPFDLGTFDEIVHHRGARGSKADQFSAGFVSRSAAHVGSARRTRAGRKLRFKATFARNETAPLVVRRHIGRGSVVVEESHKGRNDAVLTLKTPTGEWEYRGISGYAMTPLRLLLRFVHQSATRPIGGPDTTSSGDGEQPEEKDIKELRNMAQLLGNRAYRAPVRPFASAPVRSRPRRTYDPARPASDPEGEGIPMRLARMFFHDSPGWHRMKDLLEGYGKALGIFDELRVSPLGKKDTQPFQVQVRKFGGRLKGPWRNLIDVGYGVSQVLPLLIELLRRDPSSVLLLQQPEVHLHPSAQAALGTVFGQAAGSGRQLLVETHSDHLIDRVRMDVRDGATGLQPKDVSILFFERDGLDVRIHSIRLDGEGNVLGAPPGYREFFTTETNRLLRFY